MCRDSSNWAGYAMPALVLIEDDNHFNDLFWYVLFLKLFLFFFFGNTVRKKKIEMCKVENN